MSTCYALIGGWELLIKDIKYVANSIHDYQKIRCRFLHHETSIHAVLNKMMHIHYLASASQNLWWLQERIY